MPRFRYEALNAEGAALRGTIEAGSEREAARLLDRRGLAVVALGEDSGPARSPLRTRERRMRMQDLVVAFHELATMLQSGVALLDALGLAQEGVRSPDRRARLDEVARAVRAGTPLAEALEEQAALTATGYNLVRVGERSGELPAMLRSLGRLCENAGQHAVASRDPSHLPATS